MKHLFLSLGFLAAAAPVARAQDPVPSLALPEFNAPVRFDPHSLIGPRLGFVMATDADEAVPFVGLGARFRFSEMGAIEVSVDYWKDEYEDGDVEVTHYPVMASILVFFPIEVPTTSPYIFAGIGFHGASFEFSGAFSGERDDTDSEFSFHAGAGLEMTLSPMLRIHMDVRWILLDPDPIPALRDEDFDAIQFSFGLDFQF